MKLVDIIKLIDGKLCCRNSRINITDREYDKAFSSDLMSDCLAFVNDNCLLITGLTNLQSIRTAEMLDIDCIIFVRGKYPNQDMISFAEMNKMVLISTNLTMYETSGVLYKEGLGSLKLQR